MEIYKGKKLDNFQKEAFFYIEKEYSVILSAPTGSGKTLLAEYVIEKTLEKNKGIIYTAPIKALSNQKYRDFYKAYQEKVGIITGDVSLNPRAPIIIMTTEIFRNIILEEPQRIENKEWVIFDEIHYLDDIERGTVWEEALILLPPQMKILALSATVSNIKEISAWLKTIHSHPLKVICEEKRPVPLRFFFQFENKIFVSLKELKNYQKIQEKKLSSLPAPLRRKASVPNRLSSLFKYLKENNQLPCIYFSFSRRKCEIFAEELHAYDFLKPEEKEEIMRYYNHLLKKFNLQGNRTAEYLKSLLKRGIAFHHAGLLPSTKEILERLFTLRLIKVIFTTETFALGVNMPAKTVVFDSLQKYYGNFWRNLKSRDFYQMAGRAGRRGIDKEGFVFLKVKYNMSLGEISRIINSPPERINSQFRNNYATIINLYQRFGNNIYSLYPLSFHAWEAKERRKKEARRLLKDKIYLLKELEYISNSSISAKGKLAAKLYNFELQIGEIFSAGWLDNFSPLELATLAMALVYEPRRREKKPQLSHKVRKMEKDLRTIIKFIHKREKRRNIYPLSKKLYFHLSEIVKLWFKGEAFEKIEKRASVDEGTLVRYLRMSIQVLRQMQEAASLNEELKKKIDAATRRINRGIVNAEKELEQELF